MLLILPSVETGFFLGPYARKHRGVGVRETLLQLDLFIADGAVTILESLGGNPYPFNQRNLLLHSEGTRFSALALWGYGPTAFPLDPARRAALNS